MIILYYDETLLLTVHPTPYVLLKVLVLLNQWCKIIIFNFCTPSKPAMSYEKNRSEYDPLIGITQFVVANMAPVNFSKGVFDHTMPYRCFLLNVYIFSVAYPCAGSISECV